MLWSPWRSYFTTRSLNPFLAKWWWWPPLMRWSLVVGVTFRGSCQAPGQCLAFHFELAPLAPSLRVSMCLPAEKLLWSPLWPSCMRSSSGHTGTLGCLGRSASAPLFWLCAPPVAGLHGCLLYVLLHEECQTLQGVRAPGPGPVHLTTGTGLPQGCPGGASHGSHLQPACDVSGVAGLG